MASPFAVFRRNQKIMLAIVGIGAMVAFVFLTPLMQYMGAGSKVENPVVVETKFGNLTASELDMLRYQREVVDRFLQRVTVERVTRQLGQSNLDTRWLTGLVDQQYTAVKRELMDRSAPGPEAAAIETLVLSERARQMGMVITDEAVNELLKQLTADSISATELRDIIRSLSPQRPISVPKLFDALRTEMLASQYIRMFQISLSDLPPAQRFEYFARLNRRAKAEVMPLAVADFIGQVADPTPAEVEAFYEKYKNDFANPASPNPGFKEPDRASFQYFKANLEQVTDQLKSSVTEEEIKKYYDENKRNFPLLSLEDSPPAEGTTDAKPAEGETPASTEPESAGTESTEPEKKEGESPAPEAEKPAPESTPGDEQPADEKPAETPAAEKPAEAAPEEKPAEEKPAEEPAPQSRSFRGAGQTFRLVSAVQDEPAPAAEETKPEAAPAQTQPAPAEQAAEAAPTETAPSEKAPAEEKPGSEPAKPEDKPADAPAEKPAEPEMPAAGEQPAAAGAEAEPQYEPLEKVADTIRGTLAREKAAQRLYEQVDALSAKMRSYGADYDRYTVEKSANPKLQPPKPLDLAELAKGQDLQPFELQSLSPVQVAKEDLGKSFRTLQNARGTQSVPFVTFAYADTVPEYRPEVTQDNDNNVYLFWKTKQEPSYVPPLDQIREQVVRAWKMVKARDLARKRGEEFAQQARSLSKPLTELFGSKENSKVTETQPFSWLTFGNVPAQPGMPPRLSEVDGVSMAGPEFMKTAFDLNPGGVGVAINEPQDTVYVVRLIDFEPSFDELRDTFAREQPSRYLAAAAGDFRETIQKWIADLNKEADVHWVRQADVRAAEDEQEEL